MDGGAYCSYNYECAHVMPLSDSEGLGHGAHMSRGRCYSIRVCHPVKYFYRLKRAIFTWPRPFGTCTQKVSQLSRKSGSVDLKTLFTGKSVPVHRKKYAS